MTKPIISYISILMLSLAGCAHRSHVPVPTQSWTYINASDQPADYLLRLSLSMPDHHNVGEFEYSFVRSDKSGYSITNFWLPRFPMSGSSIYGDGPTGYTHIHSSANVTDVTPSGVLVEVTWDYKKRHEGISEDRHIEAKISIPFTKKGSEKNPDLHYKWNWVKPDPNHALQPTPLNAGGGTNAQGGAAEI